MGLVIGVPKELGDSEQRVALVPEVVKKFKKLGVDVLLEQGAGEGALLADSAYEDVRVVSRKELINESDLLVFVSPPDQNQLAEVKAGTTLAGFMAPHGELGRLEQMKKSGLTVFSMELVPRISRAQSMDALSSQAAVAGYKAVLAAAQESGRFFPMLTTAAGTIKPSKVLVIGAGVAGLQALATARRLGAITQGYDVRPETKEQVESLGAKFLELSVSAVGEGGYARELTQEERQQQQDALKDHLASIDVVITTAAVPGRKAPRIITQDMVENMKPGSVIVDIAAETGGNCELSQAGETKIHNGVVIVGPVNLASQLAMDSSDMYARNLYNFLSPMIKEGELSPDWEDQVVVESALTRNGEVIHPASKERMGESAS